MKLVFSDEIRVLKGPEGSFWSNGWGDYEHFAPMLKVFDGLVLACRCESVTEVPASAKRIDGPGLTVHPVQSYHGPLQYALRRRSVIASIRHVYDPNAAYLLRTPSNVGTQLAGELIRMGHPYGIRIVADPYEGFSPGANKHLLRPLFRFKHTRDLLRLCRSAAGVTYVSRSLHKRYPARSSAFVTITTDANLDNWYAERPKRFTSPLVCAHLVNVGSFTQHYKGQGYLLDAVRILRNRGYSMRLTLIGEGRYLPYYEKLATRLGVSDCVRFAGAVMFGEGVKGVLDEADLFVLPSLTEGLPRALLEAMALGLPCIGSNVGGIPELLPPNCLVPARNSIALADLIEGMLSNPQRMSIAAGRNLAVARQFEVGRVNQLKVEFYTKLLDSTKEWLRHASVL